MKAVVAAFNQEKALVGAFSVITNLRMEFGCNVLKHYSKVNIRLELEAEAEPAAKASPGYIQLPASSSSAVTLSPHKLGTGASPRALEPHNTRV